MGSSILTLCGHGQSKSLFLLPWQMRVVLEVQPRRSPLDAAQQQMLDGIEANRAQLQSIEDGPLDFLERERLQQTQYLHVLPLAALAQSRFQQPSGGRS